MRVVYERGIIEKLSYVRRDAQIENREIEKVVLDLKEARALLTAMRSITLDPEGKWQNLDGWLYSMETLGYAWRPQPEIKVLGMKIEIEK